MSVEVRVSPDGKYELEGELPPSALYNRDLAPTPIRLRGWGLYSYLALWIGTAVVIPSWSLANVGLVFGFDWLTAVVTVILGNAIVTVPLLLNSHVGAKYGIPFPVFVRASFGTFGANVAALMRAWLAAGSASRPAGWLRDVHLALRCLAPVARSAGPSRSVRPARPSPDADVRRLLGPPGLAGDRRPALEGQSGDQDDVRLVGPIPARLHHVPLLVRGLPRGFRQAVQRPAPA